MEKLFGAFKGILGFGKKEGTESSIERMMQSGNWTELTEEEMMQISAPAPAVGEFLNSPIIVEEAKVKRTLVEILSKKTERKEGFNKLFHSAIVKLSDGNVIDAEDVSGDTAVKIGYHPAGYSQWNEEVVALEDGTFSVTWNSFNTCD